MLENTFCHVQGIGAATERRLWEANVGSWELFLNRSESLFGKAKTALVTRELLASMEALDAGLASYFYGRLKSNEHWRMFRNFKSRTAYIDIETTGLSESYHIITTIALYDGENIRTYVNGDNLERFVDDIMDYDLIVTYNGKTFDVPFIESFFRVKLSHAHIDLRYVLAGLGYKGGLKNVEKQFGISRNELDGVDGYFAVLLWHEYKNNGCASALDTLIAYNVEDVVNLELLMHHAYNMNISNTPFAADLGIGLPPRPIVPYYADLELVHRLRAQFHMNV